MANVTWLGTTSTAFTTAANWSGGSVPSATDSIRFVANYSNAIAAHDFSGTTLADVVVEKGYAAIMGSKTGNLKLTCTFFEFSGTGVSYIDLAASSIAPRVVATASTPGAGLYALYLIGSALTTLSVEAGSVGVAAVHGTTATVATIRQRGGDLRVGEGTTLTTYSGYGGTATILANMTNANLYGAAVQTGEQATITTLTVESGVLVANSSGTITTATINGGELDLADSGGARTVTTLQVNPGGSISYDPAAVTLSTISEAAAPIRITTSAL